MNELATNALALFQWIDMLSSEKPRLPSSQFPDLPIELSPDKPLDMAAHITFANLRIAAHSAYEIAFLTGALQGESLKTPLIVSRTSVEASANARYLGRCLSESGDRAFLAEGLRERIWMARQASRVAPGGVSEHLGPALRYAQSSGLLTKNQRENGLVETDAQFAARIERGRNMSDRIEALFPNPPNKGFHYGWLSGFAHANPSVYFRDWEGSEVSLGFGSSMTALREAVRAVCAAFQLSCDLQYFDFWFQVEESS